MPSARGPIPFAIALACALAWTAVARADGPPPPTLRANDLSAYERETIEMALAQLHATRDPAPQGKIVEAIEPVTLEVFEERDPVPRIVNVLHATTRPWVIEREVLLRVGAPYDQVAVDDSVRNLRKLPQLSLVLAVPVVGSAPDRVRLVVITKDVWSLRLNSNWAVGPGGLESLVLQPSETNLLGTHQSLYGLFDLEPATFTLGATYRVPRVGGTRVLAAASANAVFNRATGRTEGSYGQVLATQPLYSPRTQWAWDSLVSWDHEFARRYVNAVEATFVTKTTATPERIPWRYHVHRVLSEQSITRSFGWATKTDVSLGALADLRRYRPPVDGGFDPAGLAEFMAKEAPRSDDRLGPFVQLHAYETRFVRLLDFETLGLQEDYRLGHDFYLRLTPVTRALGSTRDFVAVYAAAQYSIALKDGFARGSIESSTSAEPDRISDGSIGAALHLVTPRLRFVRIVYDARVLSRYRNYLNALTYLGGNTSLRGYPSNLLVGKDVVTSNLEVRTRPVELLHSVELGAAAFYDVGDAFDGFHDLDPKHSVGVGLRALLPQFDRLVFRADLGFPLGAGARLPGVAPIGYYFAFEQAFGVPALTSAQLPSGAQ